MTVALALCIAAYVTLGAIVGFVHGSHQKWLRDGHAERMESYRQRSLEKS